MVLPFGFSLNFPGVMGLLTPFLGREREWELGFMLFDFFLFLPVGVQGKLMI
jgi:hypothetical protein